VTERPGHVVDDATRRKAVVAATVGNFVEWYDFTIYGYFATVIAALFFTAEDPLTSILATFAIFGVAFLVRPVGALVIGSIGDRIGRRVTLSGVILLMSGATFLIGVAPTQAQVGVLAPIILALARTLQGFSAGGEFGGATSFMIEYAPEERRALYGSWQAFTQGVAAAVGVTLGVVLSSVLPAQAFEAWGWRVPFLVALPFGLIGLYLRLRLEDTPHFRAVREAAEVESAPLRDALSSHGRDILRVIGCIVFGTALTYLLIYLPTYMTTIVGFEQTQALAANLAGIFCLLALCPVSAILSERVGRKPFLVAPPLAAVVLALPIFLLLQEGYAAVLLAHALVGSLIGLFGGVYPAAFSELFPTNVRYSSLSIGYSVSVSIFGGSAPLIFTFLLQRTDSPISPAFYVILAGTISTIAALTMPETAGEALRDV
jgi:MFS transporter, MHS family, proline/betaine transporter